MYFSLVMSHDPVFAVPVVFFAIVLAIPHVVAVPVIVPAVLVPVSFNVVVVPDCTLALIVSVVSLSSVIVPACAVQFQKLLAFGIPPFMHSLFQLFYSHSLLNSLVLHAPPLQTVALPSLDEHEKLYENTLNTYSLSLLSFCDSSKSSRRIRGAFTV